MKFRLYESNRGNQDLFVFDRGQLIGEYESMDGVNNKVNQIARSTTDLDKFDTEEWPIKSNEKEAIYFMHTRLFVKGTIKTIGHVLIVEK